MTTEDELKRLQLKMLRIQQGIYFTRRRAIIVFEGFDAAGKGGAIRRLTDDLDPRSFAVHPIGPPTEDEQGKHWLYRFWRRLPSPGHIAIFDRSWYGRVLVERVDRLAPKHDWKRAYDEICQFEAMLSNDGVDLIKIFLEISKKEQLNRFKERLTNPYKQWKLGPADLRAREHWGEYVRAMKDAIHKTQSKKCPWHVIPADDKECARLEVLHVVSRHLEHHGKWMEKKAQEKLSREAKAALKKLHASH